MAMIRNKLRAIFASMCLELPSSTNDFSDFEDDEVQVRRHVKVTPSYPENTLVGLPTELRLMIYEFVLHDVVKKEVIRAYPAPITDATVLGTEPKRPSRHSTLLGSLALPHICCIVRQESLDVYTRLLKKHERSVWQLYTDLQNMAKTAPLSRQNRLLDEEVDAYFHWREIGDLRRRIERMY
jgi:hypothetical protein